MPRIAIIERDKCLKEKCGYVCMKVCPGVQMGDDTVTVDKEGFPVISEVLCTGCGICPKRCPANCITIINLAEEIGTPMHQFGVNEFRLHGLPLPKEGVVGLIGKNGIGKSTALKILAGQIIPNLGKIKQPPGIEEIAESLPREIGSYILSISQKKVKISFKPQNVDKIAQAIKGKVKDLLKKVDERGAIKEAVERFELSGVLEKELTQLSGGELQRVAIAAAWCKEADLYYFDEPSSYLDIEQRLKAAKAIKELAKQKNVIVVEHDLALFDYLSDYVYIFYGQENAYGVVSGIKNTRAGINQYLQGFLKEENTRFRDHEIAFDKMAVAGRIKSNVALRYPQLKKNLGEFSLVADAGEIMEGEVIGIIGKNAIGKSLFIKLLAGVEKNESKEELERKIKISYKPQYVKSIPEITVGQLFSQNKLDAAFFEEASRKLNVASLMDEELDNLSGGELQRVAIVLALSQNADLYLLDEPSAFLDIEQRLHLASLLQRIIQNSAKMAMVVDHDLVFLDSISSRIMVFEGEPGVRGIARAPADKKDGLNAFLKQMEITLRRDPDSGRPRINKEGSALDREQKESGEYYCYDWKES